MNKRSWMNLPEEYRNNDSYFVIIPIAYEKNLTYGTGASSGSQAILDASYHLEYYDEQYGCEPFTDGVFVTKTMGLSGLAPEEMVSNVSDEVFCTVSKNLPSHGFKFPIILGGDHSVTIGAVKGLKEIYGDFSVLILDAHSDYRDSWHGSSLNHACVGRQLSKNHELVMIGVRSQDIEEANALDKSGNVHVLPAFRYSAEEAKKIIGKLSNKVYISIDVDVFDPSLIRNTGTPEPGGLFWYDVISILEEVFRSKGVIGVDIVEFAPEDSSSRAEAYTLARLVYKIMALKHKKKA